MANDIMQTMARTLAGRQSRPVPVNTSLMLGGGNRNAGAALNPFASQMPTQAGALPNPQVPMTQAPANGGIHQPVPSPAIPHTGSAFDDTRQNPQVPVTPVPTPNGGQAGTGDDGPRPSQGAGQGAGLYNGWNYKSWPGAEGVRAIAYGYAPRPSYPATGRSGFSGGAGNQRQPTSGDWFSWKQW